MPLDYITVHWWIAVVVWAVLYTADYALTVVCGRMQGAGADRHFVYHGGYELTPEYRADIAALRVVSWRFLYWLLAGSVALTMLGLIARPMEIEVLFQLLFGALVLPEAHILTRHAGDLAQTGYARRSQAIRGRVELTMWFSLRTSAASHAAFAALWLGLAVLFASWFFVGGAVDEVLLGLKQREWARKESPELPEEPELEATATGADAEPAQPA